jgi:ethanolamine transporter EutH
MGKTMRLTTSFKVQKKHLKAVITIAACVLWLVGWLIVWELSWVWIDQRVPSSKDIKPFILIILAGYYLFQTFPSIITELSRSIIETDKLDLSNITKAKEKVS